MKRKTWVLLLAFVAITCFYSCTKDHTSVPAPINCTGIVDSVNTYNLNISNIMLNYGCTQTNCHGNGSTQGGVELSTYGNVVTAFQSQNLICTVTSTACGGILMPDGLRPLDSATIQQLKCWQAKGYPQ